MKLVDQINLNQLRVFESVYRSRSMTVAAKELHLTQSGISQHIKSLEESLKVKLFDRYKQKIIPTETANKLFKFCSKGFDELETTLRNITGTKEQLSGVVNVGMPLEFGEGLLLPIIAKFLQKYPLVQINVIFGLGHEITSMVISGELDFAYIDEFSSDKRITIEEVRSEAMELVASKRYLTKFPDLKADKLPFDKFDYISYVAGEPVLRSWFKHHTNKPGPAHFNVRATLSSPTGVLKLIQEGLGVGVVPHHLIQMLGNKADRLHIIPGKSRQLSIPICVAYLFGKSHSAAAFELSKEVAIGLGVYDGD